MFSNFYSTLTMFDPTYLINAHSSSLQSIPSGLYIFIWNIWPLSGLFYPYAFVICATPTLFSTSSNAFVCDARSSFTLYMRYASGNSAFT